MPVVLQPACLDEAKPQVDDLEREWLSAFRHLSTCIYLGRDMPMVEADGKLDELTSSKYISGETCDVDKQSTRTKS